MELITETVRDLVIYIIFATVIKNLIGNTSYAKYAEFFIGLIMILILIRPVGKLLKMDINLEDYIHSNQINFDTKDAKNDLFEGEKVVDEAILNNASIQLKEQIETLAKEEEIYVEECNVLLSSEDETFGQIKKLELWLSYDEKEITIHKISLGKQEDDDKDKFSDFVKRLKKIYEIEEDVIFVYES